MPGKKSRSPVLTLSTRTASARGQAFPRSSFILNGINEYQGIQIVGFTETSRKSRSLVEVEVQLSFDSATRCQSAARGPGGNEYGSKQETTQLQERGLDEVYSNLSMAPCIGTLQKELVAGMGEFRPRYNGHNGVQQDIK
jgi:hypothetical protein